MLRPKQIRTYATWHNSQTAEAAECKKLCFAYPAVYKHAPRSTPRTLDIKVYIYSPWLRIAGEPKALRNALLVKGYVTAIYDGA